MPTRRWALSGRRTPGRRRPGRPCQIYAYPYITPRTRNLLDSVRSYGAGLFADLLEYEQKSERVLIAGEHFTAFVPFAARWPVEVHMLPHRHVPDLAGTSPDERDEIAVLYRRILRAIDLLYDTPTPYIAAWHQAPVHAGRDRVRSVLDSAVMDSAAQDGA